MPGGGAGLAGVPLFRNHRGHRGAQRGKVPESQIVNSSQKKRGFFKKAVAFGVGVLAAFNLYTAKPAHAGGISGFYHGQLRNGTNIVIRNGQAYTQDGKYLGFVTPNGSINPIHGLTDTEMEKKLHDPRSRFFFKSGIITPQQEQPSQTPKRPVFNYSTAKEYIDEANKAYKAHDYKRIILLSEEALKRIQQGTLKATEREKSYINHFRIGGYDLINRH